MAILTFFRRADESQGLHISISVKRGTPAKTQDTLIQSQIHLLNSLFSKTRMFILFISPVIQFLTANIAICILWISQASFVAGSRFRNSHPIIADRILQVLKADSGQDSKVIKNRQKVLSEDSGQSALAFPISSNCPVLTRFSSCEVLGQTDVYDAPRLQLRVEL